MRKKKAKLDNMDPEVFTSPESSNVEGGSYLRPVKEAILAYRDKKNPDAPVVYYGYVDFEPEDWDGLVSASSKGTYIAQVIKKKYKGVKIT